MAHIKHSTVSTSTPLIEASDSDSFYDLMDKVALASGIEAKDGVMHLPIRGLADLDGFQTTFRSFHAIFSGVLGHYASLATSHNSNVPIPLDKSSYHPFFVLARWLERIECAIFEALNELPHDMRNWEDLINTCGTIHQSLHSFSSRFQRPSPTSFSLEAGAKSFFFRAHLLFCHPSRLATSFLDFWSIVHAPWGRRQRGRDLILPIKSLTKRPAGHLSRLLLQHSRHLPCHASDFIAGKSYPNNTRQDVTVIDLDKVASDEFKRGYSTGADIHGFMCLLLLVLALNLLLAPSWIVRCLSFVRILITCGFSIAAGDGTLTLLPPPKVPCDLTPAYAILLEEELSVVLLGTQDLVEAITLKGFHFSYPFANFFHPPIWKLLVKLTLEGAFQGLFCLMVVLPVWQLTRPSITSPLTRLLVTVALGPCVNFIPMTLEVVSLCDIRFAFKLPLQARIPDPIAVLVTIAFEFIRITGRTTPLWASWALYTHEHSGSSHNDLLLLDPFFPLFYLFMWSIPSRNYPIQMNKFFGVIGNPPVNKWQFRTLAAASTFKCLVLGHDIRRPARKIDVRGLLDTFVPDQREVWSAWKERVADRITHEEDIIFAPTLPTFRDAKRQQQLNDYLDEAQYAYNVYRNQYVSKSTVPNLMQSPQHPIAEEPTGACPVLMCFKFATQIIPQLREVYVIVATFPVLHYMTAILFSLLIALSAVVLYRLIL